MNRDITSPVYDFLFQKENKKIQEAKRKCEKQLYSKIQKEEAQKQKKFKKFQEQKSFINLLSKISPLKEDKNPKWVVNVHKTKEFIQTLEAKEDEMAAQHNPSSPNTEVQDRTDETQIVTPPQHTSPSSPRYSLSVTPTRGRGRGRGRRLSGDDCITPGQSEQGERRKGLINEILNNYGDCEEPQDIFAIAAEISKQLKRKKEDRQNEGSWNDADDTDQNMKKTVQRQEDNGRDTSLLNEASALEIRTAQMNKELQATAIQDAKIKKALLEADAERKKLEERIASLQEAKNYNAEKSAQVQAAAEEAAHGLTLTFQGQKPRRQTTKIASKHELEEQKTNPHSGAIPKRSKVAFTPEENEYYEQYLTSLKEEAKSFIPRAYQNQSATPHDYGEYDENEDQNYDETEFSRASNNTKTDNTIIASEGQLFNKVIDAIKSNEPVIKNVRLDYFSYNPTDTPPNEGNLETNILTWINELENETSHMSDERRCNVAEHFLLKEAREIFKGCRKQTGNVWKDVKEQFLFKSRSVIKETPTELIDKLSQFKIEEDEPIQKIYIQLLKIKVRLAQKDLDLAGEKIAVEVFAECISERFRMKLKNYENMTLDKAFEMAIIYKEENPDERPLAKRIKPKKNNSESNLNMIQAKPRKENASHQIKRKTQQNQERPEQRNMYIEQQDYCDRCLQHTNHNTSNCPRKSKQCNVCFKFGHIAAECGEHYTNDCFPRGFGNQNSYRPSRGQHRNYHSQPNYRPQNPRMNHQQGYQRPRGFVPQYQRQPSQYQHPYRPRGYQPYNQPRGYGRQMHPRGYGMQMRPRGYGMQIQPRGYGMQMQPRGYGTQMHPRSYGMHTQQGGYRMDLQPRSQVQTNGDPRHNSLNYYPEQRNAPDYGNSGTYEIDSRAQCINYVAEEEEQFEDTYSEDSYYDAFQFPQIESYYDAVEQPQIEEGPASQIFQNYSEEEKAWAIEELEKKKKKTSKKH